MRAERVAWILEGAATLDVPIEDALKGFATSILVRPVRASVSESVGVQWPDHVMSSLAG
jgi:hypothetical protein